MGAYGTILHYNGSAWTAITLDPPISMTLHGVWGSAYNNVFAVGTAGTILHYNGITWSSITLAPPISMTLYGIWGSSATDVFAVGAYGTILHYDGNTWSAMPSWTTMGLTGVWGNSEDDVFAVGYGGTVLHYGVTGTTSSSSSSTTTSTIGRTFYISNQLAMTSNAWAKSGNPMKHIPTLMKDVKLYCVDPQAKLYTGSYVTQDGDTFVLKER